MLKVKNGSIVTVCGTLKMGRLDSAVPNTIRIQSPSHNRIKSAMACGSKSSLVTSSDHAVTKPSLYRVLMKIVMSMYVCMYKVVQI